jgi:hypothetical protein
LRQAHGAQASPESESDQDRGGRTSPIDNHVPDAAPTRESVPNERLRF